MIHFQTSNISTLNSWQFADYFNVWTTEYKKRGAEAYDCENYFSKRVKHELTMRIMRIIIQRRRL